jgi:hypothetical protein
MTDVTERLQQLISRGYQFVHRHDSTGGVVAITGVRAHHGMVDMVHLYGAQDADAVRIPASEPNILFPHVVLWRSTGAAVDVLDALLVLADPNEHAASGHQPRGCWVPVRPGRATWLPATA